MDQPEFRCQSCGRLFSVPQAVLDRYPGWTPRTCRECRDRDTSSSPAQRPLAAAPSSPRPEEGVAGGPGHGIFTDGACSGNPGPGGWAAIRVRDGRVVEERSGFAPQTTNNRMELAALIAAYEMLPPEAEETIWSDSRLCVRTVNEWARQWERRGWKRRGGAVENLDLVQQVYALAGRHPKVRLRWIKGHGGRRWNEHADRLAREALQRGTQT